MARVTITQDNMDRSKLVPPGWYPLLVSKYELQQAGTDGSDLHVYEIRIDSGTYKGVILRFQVSEKAEGMGYEFWEACGTQLKPGVTLDPASFVGKRCEGFVQRGEYKGKQQNQLTGTFRPSTTGAGSAEAVKA